MIFSWIDQIVDGERVNTTQLVLPKVTIGADQTVRLDARTGKPLRVTIPDKTKTPLLIAADAVMETGEGGSINVGINAESFEELFIAHVGAAPIAGFHASVQTIFGNIEGEEVDPDIYTLAWKQDGKFYNGFTKDVRQRDLVTIRQHIANAGPELGAVTRFPRLFPNLQDGGRAITVLQTLPAESTQIVNAETAWDVEFGERFIDPDGVPHLISATFEQGKAYEAGKTVSERFNRAVAGPGLPPAQFEPQWVSRVEDEILLGLPLHSDAYGRAGLSMFDKARTALYRNGQLVGEAPELGIFFTVPPGEARYRAEVSAERGAPFRLSTNVSIVWEFKSSHVDGAKQLPVTAFRFAPLVDANNVARAGAPAFIPVNVMQQADSDAKRLKFLNIDVSYDEGKTWRKAQVINLLGTYLLVLRHPNAAGFVSLRAKAEDRAGNTVTQTVIRAYEIK
jgi:hypothetical protein